MAENSLVGRSLGPFLILAELGRGGTGVVYRARRPSVEREVALKVFHPWLASQPGFASSLLSELRRVSRLQHPNIAAVLDVGEAEGHYYLVSDLADGRSLGRLLRDEGSLPPERALRIALGVAIGLDYAHAAGFVHGDVKPGNVVVESGDRATLTDLGVARLADGLLRATSSVITFGTPEYMSPEQIEGKTVGSASDRYAFGILLYQLLVGQLPFQADTPVGVMMGHIAKPPPRASEVHPGLPAALDGVLARALSIDPEARPQTCADLVLAATAALGSQVSALLAPPPSRRRLPGKVLVVAVLVLAILGAAALSTRALLQAGRGAPESATATAGISPATSAVLPAAVTPVPIALPAEATPTASPPSATASPPPTPLPAAAASPTALPTATTAAPATPTPRAPTATAMPTPTAEAATAPGTPTGTLVLVRRGDAGTNDLYTLSPAGRSPERLSSPSPLWRWAPAVSADGSWIAFAEGVPPRPDIVVMRRDGSERRVVARSDRLSFGSPAWTPDGRVAFNGDVGDSSEIYAVSREGGELVQLTRAGSIKGLRIPTWPRQDGLLAFTGRQDGVFRVFVQPPGGEARAISPPGAAAYAPAWSPDGRRLAFSGSAPDGRAGVFTIAADGGGLERVAGPNGGWACCAAWSPDGAWLVYVAGIGPGANPDYGDAFVVAAGGGEPIRVTADGRTYNWRPAWLP